jgi:hypothetical protein
VPIDGWAQSWATEFALWRLSRPDVVEQAAVRGRGYALHVAPDAMAVTVRAPAPLHIPAAVLLKVWPRPGARLPVATGALVAAACRHHRAPFCVYAGWNRHAVVRGVPVPRPAQPSPLNVVLKVLDESAVDRDTFSLDTWELLDMDAY